MQYCPKCKTLQQPTAATCETCQGELRSPEQADPVLLAEDVEYEILQLCAALSEQDLPFQTEGENTSVSSFKSRGFRGNSRIFVRCCDYDKARGIAGELGFLFPETAVKETAAAKTQEQAAPMTAAGKKTQSHPQSKKEKPEMSKTKQRMLRAFLMVCVLAAVTAVVLLSDTILGWLRGLFGG